MLINIHFFENDGDVRVRIKWFQTQKRVNKISAHPFVRTACIIIFLWFSLFYRVFKIRAVTSRLKDSTTTLCMYCRERQDQDHKS